MGIRDITARVLIARGVNEVEVARRYVAPRLNELRPPAGLSGFEKGVARIAEAVQRGGYRSNSANFRAIVNQTLIKDKRFGSAGRGMYQLKK